MFEPINLSAYADPVLDELPESVYERARETAEAASLSLEDVLTQSIQRSLPILESELPEQVRSGLVKLSLLGDEDLWKVANMQMDRTAQERLEHLVESQKARSLTDEEQTKIDLLLERAQDILLQKAEAYRLLSLRGYTVFPQPTSSHSV